MTVKYYCALFTLFFALMPHAFAWNATGHKLVAQLAYQQLNSDARERVDQILGNQFINASVWADQVRAQGNESMNTWHYINLPKPGPQKNVVDAIADAQLHLNNRDALRGLIHWVGDIHQPLHTIGRERGGTLFILADNSNGKNLHQLWDNGAGSLKNISDLKKTAHAWQQAYPPTAEQLQETDPMMWAQEGYLLATSQVYLGITPHTVPSTAYIERAQVLVQKQIVLAGARLAQILNAYYSNPLMNRPDN